MDELRIKYHEDGRMVIRLGNFFPASQVRLRKLLKVIDMDWDRRDEILDTMAGYLRERIRSFEGQDAKYLQRLETNLKIVEGWGKK